MSINNIHNNYEFNLHTNDIMINIINIIKDDINCLVLLAQTNKEIRNNIIKNTSYINRKEDIIKINKLNFEKMYKYIRKYSELKVNNDNNDHNMLEYFSKIQNLIPYMVSSHLYKLNIELCVNYSSVNYWANNPPKYMDRCMIEESKILYSIIKQIDPQYEIVIPFDNYIVEFDSKELIDWLDSLKQS